AARLDDPALSAVALFNYIDARDAAEFVDAWLTADAPSGTTFFVGAADALAREPVPELVARHLPALAAFAEHLGPHQALFDTTRACDLLGWTPRRSWRTELDDQ